MAAEDTPLLDENLADAPLPTLRPHIAASTGSRSRGGRRSVRRARPLANVVREPFGKLGAADRYEALRNAGRQSSQHGAPAAPTPAPAAGGIPPGLLPGDPNASGLNYVLGGGGAAAPSPLADLFGGAGTNAKMQAGVLQRQAAVQEYQQRAQAMVSGDWKFLGDLRANNVPLPERAKVIYGYYQQQGRPVRRRSPR